MTVVGIVGWYFDKSVGAGYNKDIGGEVGSGYDGVV